MKIIKDNTNNKLKTEKKIPDVLKIHCSECDSELEITKEDTHIGWLGAAFINCPCCGQEAMVDEMDGITLTIDNVKFPIHFHRTALELGKAKEISATEIEKEIKRGVEHFRSNFIRRICMKNQKDSVRMYKLQSGDVFSVTENRAFDVMSKNSIGYRFVPIKRYKRIVWYKPSTWFRWLWQIECYLID